MVIDNRVALAVELRGQRFFRQRHTHRIGQTLTQRARGGLHARGVAVFGVTGGFTVQLTELLHILNGNVVASEVQ